jgi:hypothetical protein
MQFLNSDTLPTAMQTASLGLVTIFIPVVIALIQDLGPNAAIWDRAVIFSKVIRAESAAIGFVLVFLPTFLWSFISLRPYLFVLFLIGVWLLFSILRDSYRWIRTLPPEGADRENYRNKMRIEYLSDDQGWDEKERVWGETWKKNWMKADGNSGMERDLIQQFIGNIDALIIQGNHSVIAQYLRTFYAEREKRTWADWSIYGDFFSKMLEWYFIFDQEERQLLNEGNTAAVHTFEVEAGLRQLLKALVHYGLEKGNGFQFFQILENHIAGKDAEYIKRLFIRGICTNVFEVQGNHERFEIWGQYFPSGWKTTKETLQDQNNLISKIWLNQFFEWAQRRIWNPSTEEAPFDTELDDVAEGLFPTIDPIWWSAILSLLMGSWGDQSRMKAWIERHKNFGYSSRVITGSYATPEGENEAESQLHKMIDQGRKDTIELAVLLFPGDFSIARLTEFLKEMKALEYDEQSSEAFRRREYQQILEALLQEAERMTRF